MVHVERSCRHSFAAQLRRHSYVSVYWYSKYRYRWTHAKVSLLTAAGASLTTANHYGDRPLEKALWRWSTRGAPSDADLVAFLTSESV